MKALLALSVLTVLLQFTNGQVPQDSDFYTDGISMVDQTVDLVTDYKANGADYLDDSEALQKAIDDMTLHPHGGKIIIPKGTFHLMGILMKNNVHIVIDSATTIIPTTKTGVIFSFGLSRKGSDALIMIKNTSIRGKQGLYTVDLQKGEINEKLWFVNCRHVNNFMISDFYVLDHYTKMSCVTVNLAQEGDTAFCATNGVIKNGDMEHGHVGYGLIQVQCGQHLLFKNLAGQGGVTLRMESGAVSDSPDYINIDSIWARDISTRYGSSAFIMGSHTKLNGYVNIDGVQGISSGSVGSVGRGFVTNEEAAEGKVPGHFQSNCVIKNIHGVFGTDATVKWKNFDQIPCELRHLIAPTKGPDSVSYKAPSYGVFGWNDPEITNITNITGEGYEFGKIIYSKADEIQDCGNVSLEHVEHESTGIFPNPAQDFINVTNYPYASFQLFDLSGKRIQHFDKPNNGRLNLSDFQTGIYFLLINDANKTETHRLIIN